MLIKMPLQTTFLPPPMVRLLILQAALVVGPQLVERDCL